MKKITTIIAIFFFSLTFAQECKLTLADLLSINSGESFERVLIENNFESILYTGPTTYLEFIYLMKHSIGVITDSGGISDETTFMNVPCLSLRESTERPETITIGTNELCGSNPELMKSFITKMILGEWKSGSIPELWDGCTGKRIVEVISNLLTPKEKEVAS